jgi:activator of HSP90 ATPase
MKEYLCCMSENKSVGYTKDSGYQVGVRRTVNYPVKHLWKFLLSKKGMAIWLGTWEFDKWETGIEYLTHEGIRGKIRVFKVFSHIRLSWQRQDWTNRSILQIRTTPKDEKTTLSFHQEKLLNSGQRKEMKQH